MEKKPIQDAERRARRERKLGENPVCNSCGNEDFWALIEAPEKLLQEHHVAGRQHDAALTLCFCMNCHALLHEDQRKAGVSLKPTSTFPERLAEMLVAIGTLLKSLGERMILWGEQLFELVCALTKNLPEWLDLPEAS